MTLTSTHHPTVPWVRLGLAAAAITLAAIALVAGYRLVTDNDATTSAPAAADPAADPRVVGPTPDIGPHRPARTATADPTTDPRVVGPTPDVGPHRPHGAETGTGG